MVISRILSLGNKTGSITLYKYDLTSATGDGVPVSSFVTTGEKDATAEAAFSDHAIQGIKFICLKVADLGNRATEPEDGKADVSLLYSMTASDKTANPLSALGLSYADAYNIDGTTYDANMLCSGQFQVNMTFIGNIFNFCDNDIFQIENFCGMVCVTLILLDFIPVLNYFFTTLGSGFISRHQHLL